MGTTETEYYINAYTDFGDYMQPQFHEYQEGDSRRSKGSTTFIIKGRTPPSYDISINSRSEERGPYSKGGSSNSYYSTTNNRKKERIRTMQEARKKNRRKLRNREKVGYNDKKYHPELLDNDLSALDGLNMANTYDIPTVKISLIFMSSKILLYPFLPII